MYMNDRKYEDWIAVFRTSTDYEADLVRDRLGDSGIAAVVLTQRDHAFNLTLGDLSRVSVMVPPDQAEEALRMVHAVQPTDEELDNAAMAAAPDDRKADEDSPGSMLDSGAEKLRLSPPEEDSDEERTGNNSPEQV
jgi:hypothetical protein